MTLSVVACLLVFGLGALGALAEEKKQAEIVAQSPTAQEWIAAAANHQLEIAKGDGQYMRYRQVRKDENGVRVRDYVETSEGFVYRVLQQDGKPLSKEANDAEVAHLQTLLASPDELAKHHRREQADLEREITLIQEIPKAMTWSFAPGMSTAEAVVLDYKANPEYHAPTSETAALHCISGRIWIDAHSQRMVRMETRLEQDCNYGWGILVHINKGGTIVLEQHPVDPTGSGHPRWEETHFEMHISGSIMMMKHISKDVVEDQGQFQLLAGSPTYSDGIRLLLK